MKLRKFAEIVQKFIRNRDTNADSAKRLSATPKTATAELIKQHTVITTNSLTPEIALHLLTPACPLWTAHPDEIPFTDPFWAFYWPGGQAVTRFILDNPTVVSNKTVLDLGSGCGASAIAAAKSGSPHVIANDIDPVAGTAIDLNCNLNNVQVQFSEDNFVGAELDEEVQCILIGDMFYDEKFAVLLMEWIENLKRKGKNIILGDPGRLAFEKYKSSFKHVAEYKLSPDSFSPGFVDVTVWTVK